ncbi:ribonuclease H-like domain-containing protein [Trichoderma ceciliae]
MPLAAGQAPVRPVAIPISFSIPPDQERPEPIQQSEEYSQHLQGLVHSRSELQKSGYIIYQLSGPDLDRKRRCFRCGRHLPHHFKKLKWLQKTPVQGGNGDLGEGVRDTSQGESFRKAKEAVLHCKYHTGRVFQRKWTCCNGIPSSPPCQGNEEHTPKIYAAGELEKEWRFHETPPFGPSGQPAAAVVIDCEMGTASTGESELIRVSAVDYFSGAVLLDSLVYPDVKMLHYNTRYSGVTRQDMENARRTRSCIFGRANARRALWKFIGPDTIVIGHSGNSDLTSLRWIHLVVVDTLIVEKRSRPPEEGKEGEEDKQATGSPKAAVSDPRLKGDNESRQEEGNEKAPAKPRQRGGLSLKALAKERLAREIQNNGRGHDSVEDSMATRDILHWNILKLIAGPVSQMEVI